MSEANSISRLRARSPAWLHLSPHLKEECHAVIIMLTTILMPTRKDAGAGSPGSSRRQRASGWTTPTQRIQRRDLWNLEKDQLLHIRPMDSRLTYNILSKRWAHLYNSISLQPGRQPHSNPLPPPVRVRPPPGTMPSAAVAEQLQQLTAKMCVCCSRPSMDCIEDNATTTLIFPNLWCHHTT